MNLEIIKNEDLNETIRLVKQVFDAFEAPDYSEKGVKTFHEFINEDMLLDAIEKKEMIFWVLKDNGKIVGTIALRNQNHISLLFVDASYHKKGLGRLLFETLKSRCILDHQTFITVNSSPYALNFYKRVGFEASSQQQEKDGILYIPMIYRIKENQEDYSERI